MDLIESKNRDKNAIYRHPWELARRRIIKRLLNSIIVKEEKYTIIDIGCGDLYILQSLADIYPNFNFIGVDIEFTENELIKLNNSHERIKAYNNLNDICVIKGQKILILLMDVLEHIEDDVKFIYDLNQLDIIKSNSKLLITVPSYNNLFSSHDKHMLHFRRYSNKSLCNILVSNNYKIESKGYFFSILIIPRLLNIIKEKLIKKHEFGQEETSLTTWNKGLIVTNLFEFIFILDFWIVRFFRLFKLQLPGLSNYVICKKHVL